MGEPTATCGTCRHHDGWDWCRLHARKATVFDSTCEQLRDVAEPAPGAKEEE